MVACSSELAPTVPRDNSSNTDTFRTFMVKPAFAEVSVNPTEQNTSLVVHGQTRIGQERTLWHQRSKSDSSVGVVIL